MELVDLTRVYDNNKAFKAVFILPNGRRKTVRFGTNSNYLTNTDKTKIDRKNYIARHSVREDFNNPLTAGALSRWILWGETRDLNKNTRAFKKRFKL